MTQRRYDMEAPWQLEELMEDLSKESFARALDQTRELAANIEGLRDSLRPDITGKEFMRAIALVEEYTRKAASIQAAAVLMFSADTQDQNALALMGQAEQVLTETGNRIMFLGLWWRGLDAENAERLLAHAGDTSYYLIHQRLMSPHTLTEPEEKIISLKDVNGIGAIATLYDMITNKFKFKVEI